MRDLETEAIRVLSAVLKFSGPEERVPETVVS
jgi:hypothetical protein